LIARSIRIRRQLRKNISLHFEVYYFSNCFLKLFEINFIDEAKILGCFVVSENNNGCSLLKASKDKVFTRFQVITVGIVEAIHALFS
jgi:hypothetical protein